ncbi:hypothetical protein WJX84_007303 [Apatococcus fuscideae]|uniref:glycerophosphodiester phosphodiesterase n=1 Tax=Apatococcus fuscideae TaxID=2026836 RepID=A0AAW1SYS1_9CHLO
MSAAAAHLRQELFEGKFAIGGHRGSGMNILGTAHPLTAQYHKLHPTNLAIRENTVPSFQRAAGNGASFVEFDVQVTKDKVPVIWHDDQVCFRQGEAQVQQRPVSSFAASEFTSLRRADSPVQLVRRKITAAGFSDTEFDDWTVETEAPLPTLTELLQTVPESIGFDLEVKMTTPSAQLATEPEEIDRVVQPILSVVLQARQHSFRKMLFSSFDPEVCQALRERQQDVPVFLLSTGPISLKPHSDQRRNTVSAAIDWARKADLQGLVLDSSCFKTEPDAPRAAEQLGLVTLTYGIANNVPEWIQHQRQLGVAAVVTDNLPVIVQSASS